MTETAYSTSAEFLGHKGGRFLTLLFAPIEAPKAHIIYIPPFGEEMNRCRALVAQQARDFAKAGYSCSVVDLYGTGDSEGELHDSSLEIWFENVTQVIEARVADTDAPVILWGLRLGALLAMEYTRVSSQHIHDLILWQPVTSGKRFVTQMLRQRVASLVGKGLPAETTQEIRERLDAGNSVEISGYAVGGPLLTEIEKIDYSKMSDLCPGTVFWLENVSDSEQPVSTAAAKVIAQLQAQENQLDVRRFSDPPLWQLHKRDDAPELLALTAGLLP